ncbi:ATP-binding protein [Burkholderia sp. LMG 32019]|uniref:ATP-binding protein n=1 Tax=Burkholderia sp. LMG 32019 TaxID=3158173 RepID=UPI003C30564D
MQLRLPASEEELAANSGLFRRIVATSLVSCRHGNRSHFARCPLPVNPQRTRRETDCARSPPRPVAVRACDRDTDRTIRHAAPGSPTSQNKHRPQSRTRGRHPSLAMRSTIQPASRATLLRGVLSGVRPYLKWQPVTPAQFMYAVLFCAGGSVAVAAATWACLAWHVEYPTASLVLRLVIVVLAIFGSLLSSVLFAVLGGALLDYYFTVPYFALTVSRTQDIVALATFLVTTLIVCAMIRHIRVLGHIQHEQARLLDLTNDSIFVRDENDTIKYWNRAAETLYGWKSADAIGRHAHTLLKTVFPVPLDEINAILKGTGHWEGELVHTSHDGKILVLASRWSMQVDAGGEPRGILESNTDITQRKLAEQALRRSEAEFLAEVQRLSRTGSFGWNIATAAVSWSAETFRILEYDTATTPSIALFAARLHPEDAGAFQVALTAATRSRGCLDFHARLLMPDGTVKHAHLVAHPLDDAQQSAQYVGAVMDVSAARQAEDQIRSTRAELERVARATMLGALSASIAHEVGQPLSAILTFGQTAQRWIARDPPELDEVRACLDGVISSSMRAASIVQRVRDLTSRSAAVQRDELALNDVVEETVALLNGELAHHGIALRVDLAAGLPPISGNRIQLQQVLMNLLVNAIQAMAGLPDGVRHLVVTSHLEQNGHVAVALRDSGTGIRDEDIDRLFDAFFTTKPAGMGIGLSICQSIIESHCGRVWATNNTDRGSTFTFSLPPA